MAGGAILPADDSGEIVPAALQHRHWPSRATLSSGLGLVERFLSRAGFDRGPWLAVSFAAGIGLWFALPTRWDWLLVLALCGCGGFGVMALLSASRFPHVRQAVAAVCLLLGAGCAVVWAKSALIGAPAITAPVVAEIVGTVLRREEQPAEHRFRLTLATREPGTGRPIRVRLNVDAAKDRPGIGEGAVLRLRARLMPPAPPMLPGGYDFARAAWFAGLSATGSALSDVAVEGVAEPSGWLSGAQRRLSAHIREQLDGSPGTIAAALASGDRGAITPDDEAAMRDAGLAHLLSISGLHVSAVVAAAYFLAIKVLALWPWLALRVRLPLVAAGAGAAAGVFYTLLTGGEVPTVRSCIGAVLVLAALALGREPLSMRMVAVAALVVMLFWPEAVVGPSFQMSFAAVIAIVALHGSGPVRAFLAPRDEGWIARGLRNLAMLLATGVVIELALMPIGLFHFHRAGVYGSLANVVAIPLTTFVTMPLTALALTLDLGGLGAPAWWLTGQSIEAMLALARWTASRPGAVTLLPAIGAAHVAMFVAGGLWLALWRGRVRLLGLAALVFAAAGLALVRAPDILISGDGRHLGITGISAGELLVLREAEDSFATDNLSELAGIDGRLRAIRDWPPAQCSREFCTLELQRAGRAWRLLIGMGKDRVEERNLAAACDRADIVLADRWLPRSCRPALLKADRALLSRTGGLAIDLERGRIVSVADGQGDHGWWRVPASAAIRRPRTR